MSSSAKEGKEKESADESSGASGGAEAAGGEESEKESLTMVQGMMRMLGLKIKKEEEKECLQVLDEVTFNGIAKYILSGKCKNIVVMAGAGISTAAGIPDFRSPGTGLYDNLQQYNLPYPEAIFDIGFFLEKPEPFFKLAKELYPGNFKATTTHYFIRLLNEKGLLLRHYTQNIDTLERVAGIPGEKLVEAHGTFYSGHCLRCRKAYSQDWIKCEVFADKIPTCEERGCDGVVKPDIVFFGESLPDRFSRLLSQDMPVCDLLIIMGTSLAVQPFASLIDLVPRTTPRLLINREKCGQAFIFLYGGGTGLNFDNPKNYRDVAWLGSCDDGCVALADLLGWKEELIELVTKEHKKTDEKATEENAQVDKKIKGAEENGVTPTEETGITKTEETGITATEETGITATEETGKTKTEETGKTKTEETGKTKTEETGKTATEETGITATEETGKTKTEETGITATEETGKTKTEETGKTATEEEGKEIDKSKESRDEGECSNEFNEESPEINTDGTGQTIDLENKKESDQNN